MATTITRENIQKEISQEKLPIVLDVYAVWCGPCQQMVPIFESLEKEYKGSVKFAKLNVDEERELSIKYEVTSVPTFLLIKNNEVKDRVTGYLSRDRLVELIKNTFEL